jgi:hypothetical protein
MADRSSPAPPPLSKQTSGSSSQKPKVTRLGSLKSFTCHSSIGSQMSTLGPLPGSPPVLINEPNTCRNAPSVPLAPQPLRRVSSSSNVSTHSSQQQAIDALTVRRFSSSEASTSEPQGLSAEEALMVNKLRKASTRTGAFFRLNTINSSEYGSNPATPKISARHVVNRDRSGSVLSPLLTS